MRASSQPSALSSTVTLCLRFRSMRTPTASRLSISNSSQAPRGGDHLAAVMSCQRSCPPGGRSRPRRADELGDHDPLGAVDDEGALGGHQGEVPMKTVWLLISPVVLLMNSAVTNMGAEYVMSLSLHSSEEYLGGSNRWVTEREGHVSREVFDGLISSRSPRSQVLSGHLFAPCRPWRPPTRDFHLSLPSQQSNDSPLSTGNADPDTVSGSWIRAKETRRES